MVRGPGAKNLCIPPHNAGTPSKVIHLGLDEGEVSEIQKHDIHDISLGMAISLLAIL